MKTMIKLIKKIKKLFLWLTLERFPNLFRPTSKPFISGDTLRRGSNHIFDESKSLNPKKIKNNDLIFLSSELIEVFFKVFDKKIFAKYILITHNSDRNIDNEEFSFISDNVIHWFAQNLNIQENDRITLIPIGLENLRRFKFGRKKWFNTTKKNPKSEMIISSFSVENNFLERENINSNFKKNILISTKKFDKPAEYFSNLKKYKFVICPVGNGLDTHRIWESLLLECIPIMKRNNFTKNLEKKSIPGLYLDDWKDLNNFSELELNSMYKTFLLEDVKKYCLYNFWKTQILEKRI